MSGPATRDAEAACLEALEQALLEQRVPELGSYATEVVDSSLRELVRRKGAATASLLRAIADQAPSKALKKAAKLAIYRLEQTGVAVPAPAKIRPVIGRRVERPVRAWLSGIDGSGSRAVWILFEGGLGDGLLLCSLILNDESGVLEVAGGPITRKRLDRELAALREHQKLPWVESDPSRARQLVAEGLTLHAQQRTEPPPAFARWRRLFASESASSAELPPAISTDPTLLDRSAELADLPELGGWFLEPALVQEDGLALLQARESRLVVSDHVKAERENAIVDNAIERLFTADVRRRWARRLGEMALIFRAIDREEPAKMAAATAAALGDETRPVRAIPLVRALALRGLEMAGEVALGRVRLADVSRAPVRPTPA